LLYSKKIIKTDKVTPFYMPYFEQQTEEEQEAIEDVIKDQHIHDEQIIEGIEQKIELIEKEAYERGFAMGEKAGLELGEQKALLILEKIENILKEVTLIKEKIIEDLKPQIFDFAVILAKRVIIEELSLKPEIILTIINEALKKLEKTGTIKIKVNPPVYSLISKAKPELLSIHPDIVFEVDHSLSAPVIVGPEQEIITDIEHQIKNIIEDIKNGFGN
jgi:flagellar biosynthesis/type III secretory pathway protein FliH